MINYEGISYKVISIQNFKRFKAIEIERVWQALILAIS
jgi:hypothetical protein